MQAFKGYIWTLLEYIHIFQLFERSQLSQSWWGSNGAWPSTMRRYIPISGGSDILWWRGASWLQLKMQGINIRRIPKRNATITMELFYAEEMVIDFLVSILYLILFKAHNSQDYFEEDTGIVEIYFIDLKHVYSWQAGFFKTVQAHRLQKAQSYTTTENTALWVTNFLNESPRKDWLLSYTIYCSITTFFVFLTTIFFSNTKNKVPYHSKEIALPISSF